MLARKENYVVLRIIKVGLQTESLKISSYCSDNLPNCKLFIFSDFIEPKAYICLSNTNISLWIFLHWVFNTERKICLFPRMRLPETFYFHHIVQSFALPKKKKIKPPPVFPVQPQSDVFAPENLY